MATARAGGMVTAAVTVAARSNTVRTAPKIRRSCTKRRGSSCTESLRIPVGCRGADGIHIGDKVTVKLMGETRELAGHVDSIAGGIEDRDRSEGASLLANVNPTFSWVRLAQRIPVRIADSLIGKNVRIHPGAERPRVHRFLVGDNSEIGIV